MYPVNDGRNTSAAAYTKHLSSKSPAPRRIKDNYADAVLLDDGMEHAKIHKELVREVEALPVQRAEYAREFLRILKRVPDDGLRDFATRVKHAATEKTARDLSRRQVKALIEDSTLGRLQRRYAELLATVELPKDGKFKSLAQAQVGARLESTFHHLQERRSVLGMEPLVKDERVLEAKRLSVDFYRDRDRAKRVAQAAPA